MILSMVSATGSMHCQCLLHHLPLMHAHTYQLGVALSYALWAVSYNFGLFVLARILAGASKGNISLSTAIVTDVTTPERRSRGMVSFFGEGYVQRQLNVYIILCRQWWALPSLQGSCLVLVLELPSPSLVVEMALLPFALSSFQRFLLSQWLSLMQLWQPWHSPSPCLVRKG